MEKKYELTDDRTNEIKTNEIKLYYGEQLHRIRALRDFGDVKKGDFGGWVESEDNLSHEGNCWIYDDAVVSGNAVVFENARVEGNARVVGFSKIYGNARVMDNATVAGMLQVFPSNNTALCRGCGFNFVLGLSLTNDFLGAHVFENAVIRENAKVHHNSKVHGSAVVRGDADIGGKADVGGDRITFGNLLIGGSSRIYGDSIITSNDDYITIGPIGSRADYTTFSKCPEGIYVVCGCFEDSIQKFEKCVSIVHEGTKYEEEYLAAIACAKKKLLGGN